MPSGRLFQNQFYTIRASSSISSALFSTIYCAIATGIESYDVGVDAVRSFDVPSPFGIASNRYLRITERNFGQSHQPTVGPR